SCATDGLASLGRYYRSTARACQLPERPGRTNDRVCPDPADLSVLGPLACGGLKRGREIGEDGAHESLAPMGVREPGGLRGREEAAHRVLVAREARLVDAPQEGEHLLWRREGVAVDVALGRDRRHRVRGADVDRHAAAREAVEDLLA